MTQLDLHDHCNIITEKLQNKNTEEHSYSQTRANAWSDSDPVGLRRALRHARTAVNKQTLQPIIIDARERSTCPKGRENLE